MLSFEDLTGAGAYALKVVHSHGIYIYTVVGGRPQFLPVEVLLQDCLSISITKNLASPRESDPTETKAEILISFMTQP